MLQGAAYCSRPVYGHSHYKKFWLKKIETEDEQARLSSPEHDSSESFGGGIYWGGKRSTDVNFSSNDVNFSQLEMRSTNRPNVGVPAFRSGRQMFHSFPEESHSRIWDCALSIGMQTPSKEAEEEEKEYSVVRNFEKEEGVRNFHKEDDEKNGGGLHKLRVQSLKRLLHSDSDPQVCLGGNRQDERSAETEFSDGTVIRMCSDCKTDKTPLWRNGPNGPKSLCNACGIRYKKIGKRGGSNTSSNSNANGPPSKLPVSSSVRQMTKLNKRKQDVADLPPQDPAAPSHPRKRNSYAVAAAAAAITVARHTDPRLDHDVDGVVAPEKGTSCGGDVSRSFAKDEEEGAVLLMSLSYGLVNA
uniref:TSA: Wollemia nobilis Ref_Wollemi_Transcript_23_1742 transcribed RNA sequence n=1 Tax=Wollemia nobilis TaxID=56998 RepID=A0A0C9QY08_9CONI